MEASKSSCCRSGKVKAVSKSRSYLQQPAQSTPSKRCSCQEPECCSRISSLVNCSKRVGQPKMEQWAKNCEQWIRERRLSQPRGPDIRGAGRSCSLSTNCPSSTGGRGNAIAEQA